VDSIARIMVVHVCEDAVERPIQIPPATPDRRSLLLAVIVVTVGMILGPLSVVGTDFSHLPGDLVDNRFNNYILEHGYRYLGGLEPSFWHARFCYPARWVTASSDSHLGNLPIYALFRVLGAEPERAFQLWWLSTFPLTFAATVWAMRRLPVGWLGSIATATAFTFAVPLLESVGHAQLFPRYCLPIAVVSWWQFLMQPRWQTLALTIAAGIGQALCTLYLAYFLTWLLLALTLSAIVCRLIDWRAMLRPPRRELVIRGLVIGLGFAGLIVIARPYVAKDRVIAEPQPEVIVQMLPEPLDWLRPPTTAATWVPLRLAVGEHSDSRWGPFALFPGGCGLIGFAYGLWLAVRRGSHFACWLFATVLVACLFLRVGDWSVYRHLLGLPVVGNVRGLFRIGLVLVFPLVALFGIAIDTFAQRIANPTRRGLFAIVVLALVLVDGRSTWRNAPGESPSGTPLADAVARRESLATEIRSIPNVKLIHVFADGDEFAVLVRQMDAMWAAQMVGVPTTNGWTGHFPRGWFPFTNYAGLYSWLLINNRLTPEVQATLATFGRPVGSHPDEAEWQRQFPPHPLP